MILNFPHDESICLKHIGYECVGDKFLQEEMRHKGRRRKCAYCGRTAKGYSLLDIAARVGSAFETFYRRTADEMDSLEYRIHSDPESHYSWERKGEPVIDAIAEALNCENEIAEDIQRILDDEHGSFDPSDAFEETEFHSDAYYARIAMDDGYWQGQWHNFKRSLQSENRFFNKLATKHLREVFNGIEEMTAYGDRPIVKHIGPGTSITKSFRARVFQSDDKLKEALISPELHIGPPPSAYANSGRMNARGVSVFYGAIDEGTALAEVRPPVGSQVVVGEFIITRPLKVLDLTVLSDVRSDGSIFDPTFEAELERLTFLGRLTEMLSRPVMPDDETFDYLPTQAIADFLSADPQFKFDGIIFPSAQVEGDKKNLVLFQKSSRVEESHLLHSSKSDVDLWEYTDDGVYRSYTVTEKIPIACVDAIADSRKPPPWFQMSNAPWEPRPISLELKVDTLKVHVIQGVKILSEVHMVSRYRFEEPNVTDD